MKLCISMKLPDYDDDDDDNDNDDDDVAAGAQTIF